MRVEFEFDREKVAAHGYRMEQIYSTITHCFGEYHLRCVSTSEIFAFSDNGNEEDYSNMWIVIVGLLESPWFMACATACRWYDEEDVDELPEDVLSQAWKLAANR